MTTTIFPHTVNETKADYNLIGIGNVLIGFTSLNVTTKTYKNTVVVIGSSKRNLKDFIDYYSYTDGAILRFYKGKLTTTLPNIYLKDISGINISGSGIYLGVTSLGNVINIGRKEYQVRGLSDVANTTSPNKYVLTSYIDAYGRVTWNYTPEASALGRFDDVTFATVPYGVFVSYFAPTNEGGFGLSYRILPFTIGWDRLPTLGSNLNCNGKVLNNLSFTCQNISTSQPLTSLIIDTIKYSEANIVCTSMVKMLDIQLLTNIDHLKFFTLNLSGFIGLVSFKADADIALENGYLPKITRPDNTYTLIIYKDDVKIRVRILHKSRNMGSFSNGE